ncbi:hypothetical protein GEMRC1_011854 [Eukaryota sp. GEM-RC1]
MIVEVLLLCCFALGSLHQWIATVDGLWSDKNSWEPGHTPNASSSVVLPPQMTSITVTVNSSFSISSLTISSNVVLFYQNNSTLTVSDSFVINGGTLNTDISSHLSFTSADSLVMNAAIVTLVSHKLIISRVFDWKRGVIDLDDTSELLLINCTSTSFNDTLRSFDGINVWGVNDNGLLGRGTEGTIFGLPDSLKLDIFIRQASIGRHHSLILVTNGDVYTSGSNENGQLGYAGGDRHSHEKIQISKIIQVSVSRDSSFALNINGSVFSWGLNAHGQLGLGDFLNRHVPTKIAKFNNIKQIAGRRHTIFALTRDGKVFGWGWGGNNMFCGQSITNIHSPMLIDSLDNIKFIAAGLASFSLMKMVRLLLVV